MQNPHFGSKIKIPKNMSNLDPFYKSKFTCCSCAKNKKHAPKNTKYSRNESILKIGHHACKGPCKILTLAQKLKFQKTCQNPFYKSFRVVLCKKPLQKTLNIREMRSCILKIGQKVKFQKTSCKGYSPCKILTLAQKLKFQKTCQNPFYKSFRVVLCKKPLQKTLNIREMRAF